MKFFKYLGLAVLLIIIIATIRLLPNTGVFRTLEPVAFGECETLPGPVGAEDVTIDRTKNIAYISADYRREYIQTGRFEDAPNGELWSLDINTPNSQPVKMKHDLDGIFHPHGFYLFEDELYVINHKSVTEHEIAVFTIVSPTELKLRRRITYPELTSPNDLAVIGKDQVLVSNDHGQARGGIMEQLEVFLTLPLSYVSYFDGENSHIAVSGLRYANGVALNADGTELFIAEASEGMLNRYKIGQDASEWHFVEEHNANSGVDNLEWSESGTLLTGAHPKGLEFLQYVHGLKEISPSEVIEFDVSSTPITQQTILTDTGENFSGSSVAAQYGQTLLVGTVFDEQLTRCVK